MRISYKNSGKDKPWEGADAESLLAFSKIVSRLTKITLRGLDFQHGISRSGYRHNPPIPYIRMRTDLE
jgi:hypothetical protein